MAVDTADKHTIDLIPKPLTRQQRYRAKQVDQGFIQKNLWIHRASYENGRQAACSAVGGLSARMEPPPGADLVSYALGWHEIIAERIREASGSK